MYLLIYKVSTGGDFQRTIIDRVVTAMTNPQIPMTQTPIKWKRVPISDICMIMKSFAFIDAVIENASPSTYIGDVVVAVVM